MLPNVLTLKACMKLPLGRLQHRINADRQDLLVVPSPNEPFELEQKNGVD